MTFFIYIHPEALRRVNALRELASLPWLDEAALLHLLDWRDEPPGRHPHIQRSGLKRFSAILGFEVRSNEEGNYLHLCLPRERLAYGAAGALRGRSIYWDDEERRGDDSAPHNYTGYAVELPADVIRLAHDASELMGQAWGIR